MRCCSIGNWFSLNQVAHEKEDNFWVEFYLLKDEDKKSVIKEWEELWDVESKSTYSFVLDPFWSNNISESNTSICGRLEF